MLLDRAGSDRTKIEEALPHLQAAYKVNPDDLVSGMTVAQIFINTKRPAEAEKVLATLLERAPDQRALNYNYALVLMSLNREPESRQYLEKAVLLDATFTPAVLQLIDDLTDGALTIQELDDFARWALHSHCAIGDQ